MKHKKERGFAETMKDPPTMQEVEEEFLEKAEYNMGALHFSRYHEILKILDECSIQCLSYNTDKQYSIYLHYYYSALKTLYNNLKCKMVQPIREEFDKAFTTANTMRIKMLQENQNNPEGIIIYPSGYIELLEQIHTNLLTMLSPLGLHYPTQKTSTWSERSKKLLGIDKDIEKEVM